MKFSDARSVSLEIVTRETFGSDPLQVYVLDLDLGNLGRPNWVLQRVDDPPLHLSRRRLVGHPADARDEASPAA